MSGTIEWRVLDRHRPHVAWAVAAFLALVVGAPLGALATTGLAEAGADPGRTLTTATAGGLALVGLVAWGGLAWYRGWREEAPLVEALSIDAADLRWLPVAGAVAGLVVVLAPAVGNWRMAHLSLAAVAVGALGFVAVRSLRGNGRYDPESDTVSFRGRVFDLTRTPIQPVPLGPVTLLILRRPAPDPLAQYTVVPVPARVYGRIRSSSGRQYGG